MANADSRRAEGRRDRESPDGHRCQQLQAVVAFEFLEYGGVGVGLRALMIGPA
jgi:hypothetical protein